MLLPSTITARRTRRYTSTLYIHRTIHKLDLKPMNGGGRSNLQPPFVRDYPPARDNLPPPLTLDVPSGFTVWPQEPAWTSAEYQGFGRPPKPRLRDGQRRTMAERADAITEEAWREITVAEGS